MRVSLHVAGVVQGIGFRPFVQQQATRLGLSGWIRNGRAGVEIEVAGTDELIAQFRRTLEVDLPRPGRITHLEQRLVPEIPLADASFRILPSVESEPARALLPPDLAICAECLSDVRDVSNRRYAYALASCAHCGPRYSIVEDLPYDRERTTMRDFALCIDCQRDYADPNNRRFHAEPIACSVCGPDISLISGTRACLAKGTNAITQAAKRLSTGAIVAFHGLGGFQLLCLASDGATITKLRHRKAREEKPFAVLFENLEQIHVHAHVSDAEQGALLDASSPIVLLQRKESTGLARELAPNCPLIGAMLPTTAMHWMLIHAAGKPLVCTSGNVSGEPICVDPKKAFDKLATIADLYLTHDRPIVRPIDDSVVREGARGIQVLRRARGFAPLPVFQLPDERCILGVGAFLKSSVSLLVGGDAIMSQHIGDLDDVESVDLLEKTVRDLVRFFDVRPEVIACDLHPDFASTRLAERLAKEWKAKLVRVQHHHAHVASVMAERGLEGEALALVWDGYGFGTDSLAWGGETLIVRPGTFQRLGRLQRFRLPGGDKAAQEPWRCALGLLAATLGERGFVVGKNHFPGAPVDALLPALQRGISAPWTSSMGRLFDAVAALLGIRQVNCYEGQAAMELEWCAAQNPGELPDPYPIPLSPETCIEANLEPLVQGLLAHLAAGRSISEIAARFISSLVDLGVRYCQRAGLPRVVLAGGCFQNDLLTRALVKRLETCGFDVFLPEQVPINDGGISAGQVAVAAMQTAARGGD